MADQFGVFKFTVNYPEGRVILNGNDTTYDSSYKAQRNTPIGKHKINAGSPYWEVDLKMAKYGTENIFGNGKRTIFLDTGTSFNLIPYADLENLLAKAGITSSNLDHELHSFACT